MLAALILAAVDVVTLVHYCIGRDAWLLVHASAWVCWGAMIVTGGVTLCTRR